MSVTQSYCEYVLDQLNQGLPVTGKRMFGGFGLYANDLVIGATPPSGESTSPINPITADQTHRGRSRSNCFA